MFSVARAATTGEAVMGRGKILLLLAALLLIPTAADARPRGILGIVTAPLRMVVPGISGRRVVHRARYQRKVAAARHRKAALARSAARRAAATAGPRSAARPAAATAGLGVARGQSGAADPAETDQRRDASPAPADLPAGWTGPLYWPHAPDDLFDYAFGVGGERFWARGGRDLTDAILLRDGKAAAGWEEMCGSRRPGDASLWSEPTAQAVGPTEAQRRALDEFSAALVEASNGIKAHCPAPGTAASPTQRLDAMMDRLWAMRQSAIIVRPALEKFYGALDEQQKARLKDATSAGRETTAEAPPDQRAAEATGGPSGFAQLCADPTAAMMPWPNEQIERRVRPSNEQRENLQTLQMTTQGMAQLLMASCPAASPQGTSPPGASSPRGSPKEPPATPLERLDAAEKRLNAMLYAARVVGPALHGFYDSLSDAQKASFNAIGGARSSSRGVPSMARGER
jgi:LTXXQ motif family protein